MSLIECKETAVGYDDTIVADNINFTVENGDYLCILGENGAGKSTLIKSLLGLIPPVKGETDRNRVSSAANADSERFPGIGIRNCNIRAFGQNIEIAVLYKKR